MRHWLKLSRYSGVAQSTQRIQVSVDWKAAPAGEQWVPITVQSGHESVKVLAHINKPVVGEPFKGFVEADGYVAIGASHFTRAVDSRDVHWKKVPNLGRTDSAVTMFQ